MIMTPGDTIDVGGPARTCVAATQPRTAAAAAVRSSGEAVEGGHASRVQGDRRARLPRAEATRARLEHLEDRRAHRHARSNLYRSSSSTRSRRRPTASRSWGRSRGRRALPGRAGRSELSDAVGPQRPRSREPAERREAEGRKVRTPKGSAPGNARSGQLEGKWHRKYTADFALGSASGRPQLPRLPAGPRLESSRRRVRVKRCGKSAPRRWQHGWQAKPRTEQDQIGRHPAFAGRTARPKLPGRSLDAASDGGARGMVVARRRPRKGRRREQNSAYRLAANAMKRLLPLLS